jgi:putative heme-binding domain-containing protein
MKFILSPAWHRAGDARELGFVPDLDLKMVAALNDGVQSAGRQLDQLTAPSSLQPILKRAQLVASDTRAPMNSRVVAVSILGLSDYSKSASLLLPLLDGIQPSEVQSAALKGLDRFAASELAGELIRRWSSFTPSARREGLVLLLKRSERVRVLLAAIDQGSVNPAELSIAQQSQLRSHRDPAIRDQAEKVLGRASTASRQSVVKAFQSALTLRATPANGRNIFQARCATCHKLGMEGHTLGPDLATVKNAGKEKLLTNILDPNREVNSNYLGYAVETRDGESFTGLMVNESANSVTLRMAGGSESVVPRANIASMQSQGRSLMPEGLEEGLSAQEMADLLEFILAP